MFKFLQDQSPGYMQVFIAQGTHMVFTHEQYIINVLFIGWIWQNIIRLIGRIYTRVCSTRLNTKPTDS